MKLLDNVLAENDHKGHCTLSPKCSYAFLRGEGVSFPIKILVTDVKTQKIEPDPNFFMMDENFGGSVQ